MKINPITIFGVGVLGAGVLFLIFAMTRHYWLQPVSSGEIVTERSFGYYYVAVGIMLTGAVIALTGQLIKRSPKPTDQL